MYVPLDVNFPDDDKVIRVSLAATGLYCFALCLSKRLLSDGVLTVHQLARVAGEPIDDALAELVSVGLFVKESDAGDAYRIPAWLSHNAASEDVMDSAKGGMLAHRRWHVARGVTKPDCAYCQEANVQVNADGCEPHMPDDASASETACEPHMPERELETEVETETEHSLAVVPKSEPTKKPRRSPALPFPADFTLTSEMREEAEGKGIRDVDREWEKFCLHAQANDRRQANWLAAWRNWVLNSPNFTKPATNGVVKVSHVELQRQKLAASLERMTR